MKAFRFPLERVLEWRKMQLRTAEDRFRQLQKQIVLLQREAQRLQTEYEASAARLTSSNSMSGKDLNALAQYRERTQRAYQAIQKNEVQCSRMLADLRLQLIKARKDHLMLETLREKRLKQWSYLSEREIENTAAEVYLANWMNTSAVAGPSLELKSRGDRKS